MQTIEQALFKLNRSTFRSRFHLSRKDKAYVQEKGLSVIEEHARAFVKERLAPADPPHDGKQTPMRGHPIFIAQHACGCCCRGCLNRWYRVAQHVPLSEAQQEKIVRLLMAWIKQEMSRP